MGRIQRTLEGEASWRGHFECTIRVVCAHRKMFQIDANNMGTTAALRRGNIYGGLHHHHHYVWRYVSVVRILLRQVSTFVL